MNYTGQTSFAEMFEYYCTRNVANEREYNERELMRWAKQQLSEARREGWEQCQREARGKLSARYERYLNSETIYILNEIECCERAIAAMEYGGQND